MAIAIGLDIGTTSTVAVVMDQSGRVLASASRPVQLSSPAPGQAEENPSQWWENSLAVLREIASAIPAHAEISGLCVTGMLPALVLLDADGSVIRPAIQQSDARSGREVDELAAQLDAATFLARTGQGITQQLLAPKLRWLARHEPAGYGRIRTILGSYGYINWRLTGRLTSERNWALEAGLIDLATHALAPDLVALTGLAADVVPPLVDPQDTIGGLCAKAADATGLPRGLKVFGGAADHIASALAAGLTLPGDILLKFGGAGDIVAISPQPTPDARLFLDYHLVPGLYAPNGCMAASGSALLWLAEIIAGDSSPGTLAALDQEAEAVAPGSNGVRILPYFLGEKTPIHDPAARGTVTGLSLGHRRGHIWRAMLEAIACGFRHHLEVFAECGVPAARVLASDGGSRSRIWMAVVANVLGMPVTIVPGALGSCVGAAWVALVAGGAARWADVAAALPMGDTILPDPAGVAASQMVYDDYRALYPALRLFFRRA